jgi:predicted amidophosphoribosyltransferase
MQTKNERIKRGENVQKSFYVSNPIELEGKRILPVDDVFTTGQTPEACFKEILQVKGASIIMETFSMATS